MQTRTSLLVRIRDPHDGPAWSEFVDVYAPLLHAYGMKRGLQDADAADLAQNTLRQVLRAAPGFVYNPGRGTFRGWLLTIARNELRKFAARPTGLARGTGDSDVRALLEAHPASESDEAEWEREYQLNLFHWAARRVQVEFRPKSWQAFWRTVVDGEAIEAVANDLGMTPGAVYIARSRATARVRQEIEAASGDPP